MTALTSFVNALSDAQKGIAAACSLVLAGGAFASVVILALSGFVNAPQVAQEAMTKAMQVDARVDDLEADIGEKLTRIGYILCGIAEIPPQECKIETVGR